MKFKVTMKDPDTLPDAIRDAAKIEVSSMIDLDEEEREMLIEKRVEDALGKCSKWFEYSEYLTVEIDTDLETAVVVDNE